MFTNTNQKGAACLTVTCTARPFDESLENPLFFSPFTLKIFSLPVICYACDNNEGDFGTENMFLTLNSDFPLGHYSVVMQCYL